jgi:hypothetical protein
MTLTDSIDFPEDGSCPDCGCTIFRGGPRGGVSQNIECARCKSRFNVTRWSQEWDRRFDYETRTGPMPIVWAQRIPSEADGGGAWREDMFPKVLE